MNFQIHLPPTSTHHILFNLVDIQVTPEPLLISNVISKDIISGNITAAISDHLPQLLISLNTFADPPSNKSNFFERDWSNFDPESFMLDYFDID